MFKRVLAIGVLAMESVAFAGSEGPQHEMATPLPPTARTQAQDQQKLAAAEVMAKELLLLIDTDKSGKVSKKEWMTFMEREFSRLDVNKDGELDVRELTRSRVRSNEPFTSVGK
jgi:hypothetical protein